MLTRRTFLALGAVTALAACEAGPQVDSRLAATLNVVEVTAATSVTRTNTAVPKDVIVETARFKVESALRSANPAGTRPVRAEMTVANFYIANPAAGVLLGSSVSSITTTIRLVDVATGAIVKDSFSVIGTTEARPTIFGAAAIQAPAQELATFTDDLAANARLAIFGQ